MHTFTARHSLMMYNICRPSASTNKLLLLTVSQRLKLSSATNIDFCGCKDVPLTPAPNCIKHFHWLIALFWPTRLDVTIGNNCIVKPDWQESLLGTVVKSNMIDQNHPVNQGNPLYNWVQVVELSNGLLQPTKTTLLHGNTSS